MKRQLFLTLVVCLALARNARAEGLLTHVPSLVAIGGRSAGWVTSVRFTANGSGCVESNPRFQRSATDPRFDASKAAMSHAITVGALLAIDRLEHKFRKKENSALTRWAVRAVDGAQLYVGARGAWNAIHNIRTCGW